MSTLFRFRRQLIKSIKLVEVWSATSVRVCQVIAAWGYIEGISLFDILIFRDSCDIWISAEANRTIVVIFFGLFRFDIHGILNTSLNVGSSFGFLLFLGTKYSSKSFTLFIYHTCFLSLLPYESIGLSVSHIYDLYFRFNPLKPAYLSLD